MATTRAPSPHYRRAGLPPELIPNIELTDDDKAIIDLVAEHRFVDAQSIYSLFSTRPAQQISRRLRAMHLNNYLVRPPQQLTRSKSVKGSLPRIYALDRNGAIDIKERTGRPIRTTDWEKKNRAIKWWNIEHALETSKFMVRLEIAIRAREDLELRNFDEILAIDAPAATRRAKKAARFRAPVCWQDYEGEEGIEPDRIFDIAGRDPNFIFFENDEGTETIEPSKRRQRAEVFFDQSSILQKLVIYAHAFRSQVHRKRFGMPVFRPLFLTTSPKRAEHMAEVCSRYIASGALPVRPGFFLFGDRQTLTQHADNPLETPYLDGSGKQVRLV